MNDDLHDLRKNRLSNLLDKRLKHCLMTTKEKPFDELSKNGPIDSQKDVNILDSLIKTKNFILLPNYDSNGKLVYLYTIGNWYYNRIPELLIMVNDNLDGSVNWHDMIWNYLTKTLSNKLFEEYNNNTTKMENNRIDTFLKEEIVDLSLDNHLLELNLELLPEEKYYEINIGHINWFYMWWTDMTDSKKMVVIDENDEIKLDEDDIIMYPIYKTTINSDNIKELYAITLKNMFDKVDELNGYECSSECSSISNDD